MSHPGEGGGFGADTEEAQLWRAWAESRTAAARTKLFFFYSHWGRSLAGMLLSRYPHPLAEWADYVNLASMGLLQAIDRFDPDKQARFQSYAEPYVRGAVLKGLACYVKDKRKVSRDRLESLTGEGRFADTDSDLEQVVNAAVDLAFGYFLELGIVSEEPEDNGPLRIYEQEHFSQGLDAMIRQLPEREQQIIVGHYYQHLNFVELSQLMGLSRPRVSQLHAQALKRVRGLFEDSADIGEYL